MNSSPRWRFSISKSHRQNRRGLAPVSPRFSVMLADTQSRTVSCCLVRLRPPRQITGSQAYATPTFGLNTANGLFQEATRQSSGHIGSMVLSDGVLRDMAQPSGNSSHSLRINCRCVSGLSQSEALGCSGYKLPQPRYGGSAYAHFTSWLVSLSSAYAVSVALTSDGRPELHRLRLRRPCESFRSCRQPRIGQPLSADPILGP